MRNISEGDYLNKVHKIRAKIEMGDKKNLLLAEKLLAKLSQYLPKRTEYLLTKSLLELKKGTDPKLIRCILDNIATEYHVDESLSDLFSLKAKTFPRGSLGEKQCLFSASLYQNKYRTPPVTSTLQKAQADFVYQPFDPETIENLAHEYYISRHYLLYFVLQFFAKKLTGDILDYENYIEEDAGSTDFALGVHERNLGLLAKMFTDGKTHTVIICEEKETFEGTLLIHALKNLGMTVIYLSTTLPYVEGESKQNSLKRSLHSLREEGGYFQLGLCPLAHQKTNANIVLEYIRENFLQKDLGLLFTPDRILEDVVEDMGERIVFPAKDIFREYFSCAYIGLYTSFLTYMYEFDVEEKIHSKSNVQVSIVIPVRNSAKTLLHTLKTCLEQETDASYEILLSDNSDPQNDAVYKVYQQLGDRRIRYIRTPFVLPLPRSFEYAFLKARGEFIFAIGADDAVFPWTVDVLSKLLPQLSEAEVFLWERGFYTYPKFNKGQENQLNIFLKKDFKHINYFQGKPTLQFVLANDISIYTYPMLYINSGFRRSFFETLLKKTGKLWAGASQDVYMGFTTLLVSKAPLAQINAPLTIAGMSGTSIGFNNRDSYEDAEAIIQKSKQNHIPLSEACGYYVYSNLELQVPFITMDVDNYSLALAYMHLKSQNLIEEDIAEVFHFEERLKKLIANIKVDDLLFEKKWQLALYALKIGKYHALEEEINKVHDKIFAPRLQEEKPLPTYSKFYKEGLTADKEGLIIDASRYGVQNIYDAMKLSVRFMEGEEEIPSVLLSE